MTKPQRIRLAALLTEKTGNEWIADHGVHRVAGPHIPPLSVSIGRSGRGSDACFIADGWDRWLFCGLLDGPYTGRGFIERLATDVAVWLDVNEPLVPHNADAIVAEMTRTTGEPWTFDRRRTPGATVYGNAAGFRLTVETEEVRAHLAFPTGLGVFLGEFGAGEGIWRRLALTAALAIENRKHAIAVGERNAFFARVAG